MQASARFSCCHQETRAFGGKAAALCPRAWPAALGSGFARAPSSTSAARRRLREFPPPWSVEETDACFIVRDAHGQAPAYAISRASRAGAAAHLLTCDDARSSPR